MPSPPDLHPLCHRRAGGGGVAGDGDEVGEEPVHADGVGQAQAVRDLDGAVVAVAEQLHHDAGMDTLDQQQRAAVCRASCNRT